MQKSRVSLDTVTRLEVAEQLQKLGVDLVV